MDFDLIIQFFNTFDSKLLNFGDRNLELIIFKNFQIQIFLESKYILTSVKLNYFDKINEKKL